MDGSEGRPASVSELVESLLRERDEHHDEAWFREQLEAIDRDRREALQPFVSEVFDIVDSMDGADVTFRTTGTTRDRDFDADWESGFDGWSGRSKPVRTDDEDGFLRRFRWRYGRHSETWEVTVPGPLFEYYTERHRTRSFGTYISDPFDQPFVSSLANKVRSFGDDLGLGQREQINVAVRFVQSMEYTPDDETTGQIEYPKYPIETLVHDGGDCEDTSILLGALLRELGCEVALIVLPNHHHMILGVAPNVDIDGNYYEHDGTNYYTLEATGHGWDIGDLPPHYRNASAQVHPVGEDPTLVHEWSADPQADGGVSVTADVANFGDVPAEELDAYIEFEDGDTTLARTQLVRGDTILPSVSERYESTLSLPDDRQIRGRCVLTLGHRVHDSSTSDWH
ncbi:hypothetical protein [Haloplanus sp. C73]|uniref:hypothetical protein n=1 Tax=Haloplanus sp. C73 TaxID=3421641 RepID=UPI003EB8E06A